MYLSRVFHRRSKEAKFLFGFGPLIPCYDFVIKDPRCNAKYGSSPPVSLTSEVFEVDTLDRVEGGLETAIVRVLVVDDYQPWRRFVSSAIKKHSEYQLLCEAVDGLEAVQKAEELQPDLILLDIRLPKLNGIEAARQIRARSPNSKIVFVSEDRSWDVAEDAVRTCDGSYVVKSNAARELFPAMEAILHGKQFMSAGLLGRMLPVDEDRSNRLCNNKSIEFLPR